jgi:hypothetical protein
VSALRDYQSKFIGDCERLVTQGKRSVLRRQRQADHRNRALGVRHTCRFFRGDGLSVPRAIDRGWQQ